MAALTVIPQGPGPLHPIKRGSNLWSRGHDQTRAALQETIGARHKGLGGVLKGVQVQYGQQWEYLVGMRVTLGWYVGGMGCRGTSSTARVLEGQCMGNFQIGEGIGCTEIKGYAPPPCPVEVLCRL